jgi:hypothetical protein
VTEVIRHLNGGPGVVGVGVEIHDSALIYRYLLASLAVYMFTGIGGIGQEGKSISLQHDFRNGLGVPLNLLCKE